MIRNRILLIVCSLLATLTLCRTSVAETRSILLEDEISGQSHCLSLDIPDGFTIEKDVEEDFQVFTISSGEKLYLLIYDGNHPDFPPEQVAGHQIDCLVLRLEDTIPHDKDRRRPTELDSQVQIMSEWEGRKLLHREMLVRYSDGGGWPLYLHAVTGRKLSDAEFQVADRILFTLKVRPQPKDS